MPTNSLFNFSLDYSGFKSDSKENYDSNIDAKKLKQKCGKTLLNNYDTISNGCTMKNCSFFINKNSRENGFIILYKIFNL